MLLIPYTFYAQVEIKGTVKDSTNIAIEFANVVLTVEGKNNIVAGTITDKNGSFKLSVSPGEYKLAISYIGHATETTIVNYLTSNLSMNNTNNIYYGKNKIKQRVTT